MNNTSLIVLNNPAPVAVAPVYPEYDPAKPLKGLLSPGSSNTKLAKNDSPTWALSMAQHTMSGHNVCPRATPGCINACVGSCGLATVWPTVHAARIRKTRAFFARRSEFVARIERGLGNAMKWLAKKGHGSGVVRLNTFSDIAWEHIIDMNAYSTLRFYDYTKDMGRAIRASSGTGRYANYRLCYSVNEHSDMEAVDALVDAGGTAAVVLDIHYVNGNNMGEMPATYRGRPLVDGDILDDRSQDPRGCYIGLRLKGGKAKRQAARDCGFARQPE